MTIARAAIGGLVLAGGRGTRMGGADKGLLAWHGGTFAGNAVARLAPQVECVAISVNRNLERYAGMGVPLVSDEADPSAADAPFDGPLAGVLSALDRCAALETLPWLAVVPCDVPFVPDDLVRRLAAACDASGAGAAHAASLDPESGRLEQQPLCALFGRGLRDALAAYLASGRRSARGFLAEVSAAAVPFTQPGDDPWAFVNANTPSLSAAWKGRAGESPAAENPRRDPSR